MTYVERQATTSAFRRLLSVECAWLRCTSHVQVHFEAPIIMQQSCARTLLHICTCILLGAHACIVCHFACTAVTHILSCFFLIAKSFAAHLLLKTRKKDYGNNATKKFKIKINCRRQHNGKLACIQKNTYVRGTEAHCTGNDTRVVDVRSAWVAKDTFLLLFWYEYLNNNTPQL